MMCANTVRLLPPTAREVESNRANQRINFMRGRSHPQVGASPLSFFKEVLFMNPNVNYIGMVNLLRRLQSTGLVSRKEARRIAARLRAETGADVIFYP